MWSRLDGANRSTPYGHVADAQAHPGQQAATHARLHDLRHLHATTLLLSGVPVHVVAARLGHADPAIYPPRLRTRDPLSRGRRRGHFRRSSQRGLLAKPVSKKAPSKIGKGL